MKTTTVGVLPNRLKAEMIINELHAGGIRETDISCIYTNRDGDIQDSQTNEKMEIGAGKGAVAGAVLGTIAGLVVANGILPGIGSLFVAGPIVETLGLGLTGVVATTAAGAATGAIAGSIVGALVKMGVNDDDAMIYEESVKDGNVVIITHSDSTTAKAVLLKNGATKVKEYVS